jgi:cysteine synthase A
VTVISAPHEYNEEQLYVDLRSIFGRPIFLKCEGFNFAGSVKLKAAAEMVEAAEREGRLGRGSTLVESSSGNLGVALSMITASRGYRFVCVTDSRCSPALNRLMVTFGAEVQTIVEPDPVTGFLGARLNRVREIVDSDNRIVWLNQYTNTNAWLAHFRTTGPAIARHFPGLDVLFVGAGTTGTLMGCARFFRQWPRRVRIVAIDSVGSVTFGAPPALRMIPGLGTSVRPDLLDESFVDDVVWVAEGDTVRCCHRMARQGFLFGGSTGTVLSGALAWLARHDPGDSLTAVALAPDLGERYLDTVYQTTWVQDRYGDEVLRDGALRDGAPRDVTLTDDEPAPGALVF